MRIKLDTEKEGREEERRGGCMIRIPKNYEIKLEENEAKILELSEMANKREVFDAVDESEVSELYGDVCREFREGKMPTRL